jgi:hypothetical protein
MLTKRCTFEQSEHMVAAADTANSQRSPAAGTAHVVFVDTPRDARAIHGAQVTLWVWRRAPEPTLAAYVECVRHRRPLRVDETLHAGSAWRAYLHGALCAQGLPPGAGRDAWAEDLARLAALYAALTAEAAVRLRLESVAETRERVFHYDSTALRLLCTYAGPGTQWLSDGDVDRTQLRLQGRSVAASNRAIARNPGRIRSLRSWWVAVLKGEGYPGNTGKGLVHRPQPARADGARVRLRIDAAR